MCWLNRRPKWTHRSRLLPILHFFSQGNAGHERFTRISWPQVQSSGILCRVDIIRGIAASSFISPGGHQPGYG
jgi:hypothetical protein